jgi:hypothetical protein
VKSGLVVLLVVLTVACGSAGQSSRESTETLYLGIVHRDGLLIPSAVHVGREWWNPWPFSHESDESIRTLVVPASLASIPAEWLPPGVQLPTDWSLQLSDGTLRPVRLLRPERPERQFLAAFVGIRTDQKPLEGDAYFGGEPELGVAIAGPGQLGRLVPVESKDHDRLLTGILPALNKAETRAIQERLDLDWKGRQYTFPAGPETRARHPFVYTSLLRDDKVVGGRSLYYFTGRRDYGDRPYPDCSATVDFHAVVAERDGRIETPMVAAYTTFECSRDNDINVGFEPLASLHWAGPVLWVIKTRAEDGYDYSLINPAPSTGHSPDPGPKCLWAYRDQCAR